ncbi:LPS export ABC transporter periplasmic protein LptC [Granulosicoccus antarcticus]|uniref:Lipopolysaccharide export system protein LptC n=1 Tax=Granulosicoccus antarcticus IMCC3135 TaxID=1192854 RepID=A0A2Z2P3C8_9GAMM|nr:LPS export ABC transporter periplasmic protein LptC [Granulosicoccus antarcticus]ASJ75920.1 Lipopolysaccharide export system protein LptC [Granulosicoccus antarcticus IMCC3135]
MFSTLLSRYWLLIPILILVVVVVDLIEEAPEIFNVEETINMRETRSDYYMADFRSRKYDKQGQIEYTIRGETLAHYPDNDRSEITAPRVELNREGAQWQIQSDSGTFDTSPDLFTLHGDVIVKRSAADYDPITIRTSTLTVATESNEVSTDAVIEISAPAWRLQATGLKSAIDQGKLSLLSEVTGRYEVPGP